MRSLWCLRRAAILRAPPCAVRRGTRIPSCRSGRKGGGGGDPPRRLGMAAVGAAARAPAGSPATPAANNADAAGAAELAAALGESLPHGARMVTPSAAATVAAPVVAAFARYARGADATVRYTTALCPHPQTCSMRRSRRASGELQGGQSRPFETHGPLVCAQRAGGGRWTRLQRQRGALSPPPSARPACWHARLCWGMTAPSAAR